MKLNTRMCHAIVTALCVLPLTPALVLAGGTPKTSDERGIIKSVDMSTHTLVVIGHKKNADQKFQWNEQTQFIERDKSLAAGDLKQGERVHLSYSPGGETPVLQSVHIAPAKTGKHSATNHSSAKNNGG